MVRQTLFIPTAGAWASRLGELDSWLDTCQVEKLVAEKTIAPWQAEGNGGKPPGSGEESKKLGGAKRGASRKYKVVPVTGDGERVDESGKPNGHSNHVLAEQGSSS
jgi:DNA-binding helix-hairpin-helix protein with protein kinase domain